MEMKTTTVRFWKFSLPLFLLTMVSLMFFWFSGCTKDLCKDVVCPDCPKNHLVIAYVDTSKNYCDSAFHVGTTISAYSITSLQDQGQWMYSYGLADSCRALLLPNPMTRYVISNPGKGVQDTFTVLKVNRISPGQPSDANKCCFCFPIEQVAINSSREKNLPEENVDMEKVILITF